MLLIQIERWFLALAIVLSPLENSGLQATPLRFFGASPSALVVLIVLLLHCSRLITSDFRWRTSRRYWLFAGGILVSSGVSTLLFVMWSGNIEIFFKAFKYGLVILTTVYFVFRVSKDFHRYIIAVWIAAAVCVFGFIAGDVFDFMPAFLQFVENNNMRNRGFASESSGFGTQIGIFTLLCASLVPRIWQALVVFLLMGLVLAVSGSKGAVISMFFALGLVFVLRSKRPLTWALFFSLTVLAGIIVFADDLLPTFDLEGGTTVATRLTMFVLALKIALITIIGTGPGSTEFAVVTFGPDVLSFIKNQFPLPLLFNEVDAYVIGDPDANITFKTFFADNSAIFGLPFLLWFLLKLTPRAIKFVKTHSVFPGMLCIFTWMALVFYHSGYGYYSVALGVAYLINVRRNEENIVGNA